MLYSFTTFIIHFALIIFGGRFFFLYASAARDPQTRISSFSSNLVFPTTVKAISAQPYYNQTNATTAQPSYHVNKSYSSEKVCFVDDCASSPDATKTVDQYGGSNDLVPYADLEQVCVLWNSSCTGNVTFARKEFFTNQTGVTLMDNICFEHQPTEFSGKNDLEGCYQIESPERLLQFGQAKRWMRSPECISNAALYDSSAFPDVANVASQYRPHGLLGAELCCQRCDLSVQNVDIYYWPEVDVDTSCLEIIGNTTDPIYRGATTSTVTGGFAGMYSTTKSYTTYWGCTGPDSSLTITAYLTQINSITFKASSYNPWSPPPCSEASAPSDIFDTSVASHGQYASIRPRAHSLIIKPSMTLSNVSPVSTLVVEGHTL